MALPALYKAAPKLAAATGLTAVFCAYGLYRQAAAGPLDAAGATRLFIAFSCASVATGLLVKSALDGKDGEILSRDAIISDQRHIEIFTKERHNGILKNENAKLEKRLGWLERRQKRKKNDITH